MSIQLPGAVLASKFEDLSQRDQGYPESNEDRGPARAAAADPSYHLYLPDEKMKEGEVYRIDIAALEKEPQVPSHHKILARLSSSAKPLSLRGFNKLPGANLEQIVTLAGDIAISRVSINFYLASKHRVHQLVKRLSVSVFFAKELAPPHLERVPGVQFPQHQICQIYLEKLKSKLKSQMTDDQWNKIIREHPCAFDVARFEAMQKVVQENRDHATKVLWKMISHALPFEGPPPATLEEIRSFMEDQNNQEHLGSIHKLKLNRLKLKVIPQEIKYLAGLRTLDLRHNEISAISPGLLYLKELRELWLAINNIKVIPPGIRHFTQLEVLDLHQNQIRIIPSDIRFLIRLKQLYLSNNLIEKIPPEFRHLIQLEEVHLKDNLIESLPSEIKRLPKLKWISFADTSRNNNSNSLCNRLKKHARENKKFIAVAVVALAALSYGIYEFRRHFDS